MQALVTCHLSRHGFESTIKVEIEWRMQIALRF